MSIIFLLLFEEVTFWLFTDVAQPCEFSPWNEAPYVEAAENRVLGGVSHDGFLSLVRAVFV